MYILFQNILENPTVNYNPYQKYGGVGTSPNLDLGYVVVMQHPVTTEYLDSRNHINETLLALQNISLPVLFLRFR